MIKYVIYISSTQVQITNFNHHPHDANFSKKFKLYKRNCNVCWERNMKFFLKEKKKKISKNVLQMIRNTL